MRIDTLTIKNFKLFSEKEFNFHPEFNLIIGVNGTGKTSLLNAVSVALGGWANAYIKSDQNLRPIEDHEMREIQIDNRFDRSKDVLIKAEGQATIIDRYKNKKKCEADWSRKRSEVSTETLTYGDIKYSGSPTWYNLRLDTLGKDILEYIESGKNFNLPVIAFYGCDRLWLPENELNIEASAKAQYSRFDPYVDCFHTGADHQAIGEWLLKHELASLQQKKDTPILQSIRKAAMYALEDCTGLRFDFEASRVMVNFKDDKVIPFDHLSDGQRTILGLFCDIARRAAILNPHLEDASEEVEGVVLIDELDLHLHPKWQRKIIEDLRRLFPKIQFICTTHSPFLIQSLRSDDELIMLDGEPLSEYANKGIEEIAKNMGVERPDTSVRYEKMKQAAKSFLELLEEANSAPEEKQEAYKKQLAEQIAPYADNPAYQAFLELQYASVFGERFETR
ncbi:AAA family ATPase [Thiomicrospira microaerophila]|uniref:AAA family ATPase n=1 Tax=Thiomicrospira microaerophila TaxID=406020 RepID=UPI00200DACED|nr:AAA family ATPase [Thiomicrospira microaerophila]UQB42266.1 AAA family ATPase [Thiomicrospira microaerophila]